MYLKWNVFQNQDFQLHSVDLLLEEQAATDKAADEEVAMVFGPIKPSPSVIKTEMSR